MKRLLLLAAVLAVAVGFPLAQTQIDVFERLQVRSSAGFGVAPYPNFRVYAKGEDTTSTNYAIVAEDSAFTEMFYVRNDGEIQLTKAGGYVVVPGRINSAAQQPGFLAYNSANDSPVNNGATVDVDVEVYDTAGNFAADTFTAPVTGIYQLCATVEIGIVSGTGAGFSFITSNRWYRIVPGPGGASGCVFADMDASDTAYLEANANSGFSITGGATGPGDYNTTFFSGRLMP